MLHTGFFARAVACLLLFIGCAEAFFYRNPLSL